MTTQESICRIFRNMSNFRAVFYCRGFNVYLFKSPDLSVWIMSLVFDDRIRSRHDQYQNGTLEEMLSVMKQQIAIVQAFR